MVGSHLLHVGSKHLVACVQLLARLRRSTYYASNVFFVFFII
jgi:hypothetical protein